MHGITEMEMRRPNFWCSTRRIFLFRPTLGQCIAIRPNKTLCGGSLTQYTPRNIYLSIYSPDWAAYLYFCGFIFRLLLFFRFGCLVERRCHWWIELSRMDRNKSLLRSIVRYKEQACTTGWVLILDKTRRYFMKWTIFESSHQLCSTITFFLLCTFGNRLLGSAIKWDN